MFDLNSFQKENQRLSIVKDKYYSWLDEHHITCRPQEVISWVRVLKEDLNYLYFIDAYVLKSPNGGKFDYELNLIVSNLESHQRLNLHILFNQSEVIPDITPYYPASRFSLREQAELFQINFQVKLDPIFFSQGTHGLFKDEGVIQQNPLDFKEPILPFNPNKSEAPYPQESWRWKHCDLFSKDTLGKFEAFYCFDPFKLVDLKLNLGNFFRGVESLLTQKSHTHIPYLLEDLNHMASPFYSGAWAMNLEEILKLQITERAQGLRIVVWELSRIGEHLFVIYEMCSLLKLVHGQAFLDAYERLCELMEQLTGHRSGKGMIKIGGLHRDLPSGWMVEFIEFNKLLLKNLSVYHKDLLGDGTFRTLLNHAKVNSHAVLEGGVSGPALRAAGINFDLRKSRPLYFYPEIDFDVPVGVHGTSYDRYLIRFEEIIQSLRIITQVLDNLPLGVVDLDLDENEMREQLKSVGEHSHYSALESPNGEVGISYVQGEDALIKRIKIKSPSQALTQGLKDFLKGVDENSVPVALSSLGIREKEMER